MGNMFLRVASPRIGNALLVTSVNVWDVSILLELVQATALSVPIAYTCCCVCVLHNRALCVGLNAVGYFMC